MTSGPGPERGDVLGVIAAGGAVLIVALLLGGFVIAGSAIWYLFIKK